MLGFVICFRGFFCEAENCCMSWVCAQSAGSGSVAGHHWVALTNTEPAAWRHVFFVYNQDHQRFLGFLLFHLSWHIGLVSRARGVPFGLGASLFSISKLWSSRNCVCVLCLGQGGRGRGSRDPTNPSARPKRINWMCVIVWTSGGIVWTCAPWSMGQRGSGAAFDFLTPSDEQTIGNGSCNET